MSEIGYIHSLQSLGTVDGPGVRAVIFAAGCPLRCVYCHNPDTWKMSDGTPTSAEDIARRIFRLYPYIKDGGVTFSGGEPLLQAEFFTKLSLLLKERGLHIALDTSGCMLGEGVMRLLDVVDLVLLDVKFDSEDDYFRNTGGSFLQTVAFLDELKRRNLPTWIRRVAVPELNDRREDILRLSELVSRYPNIEKVELLPFRKLCLEKYRTLGIEFPLENTPEMSEAKIRELYQYLNS
ncbi:MAG: pyruvate formate lyase-activating protein [Clostridia bacterium]|nr:pyruvate formate lyase-activating protein [Clostridia bacterium]